MSLSKKSFLTGILLVIVFAMTSSAMALDGARFFRPYEPEDFGGKRRGRDGVYGAVTAIYHGVSAPKGAYIGATLANGKNDTRWAYTGSKEFLQTNTLSASMFSTEFKMGTRVEVGRRLGRHGWLFGGHGLPSHGQTIDSKNVSMVVRDEGNFTLRPINLMSGLATGFDFGEITLWENNPTTLANGATTHLPATSIPSSTVISGVGYLWGFFPYHTHPGAVSYDAAILGPVPINFGQTRMSNHTENWSLELMYTYRPHPFTWGSMELMVGPRYWELDDHFTFLGKGPEPYVSTETDDDGTATEIFDPYPNVNLYGPVSILAETTVNARVTNRVIGPQFGVKFTRQNRRWTLGMEARFIAGINNQAIRTYGHVGSNYGFNADMGYLTGGGDLNGDNVASGVTGGETDGYPASHNDATASDTHIQQGTYPWIPIGVLQSNSYYNHKANKTYFSPVLEFRIDADWQWTDAVSLNVGFTTTYADNIGRAVRVTDYAVHSDGTIFGIRGNRNASVLVYGVNFGMKVKR